ncbi:MAG: DUF2249 domain-containing protein [Gammaproteobacteria bacterium]|nr:DUF2249 domain-containing protein [Gammaproteobacteria bacterium]
MREIELDVRGKPAPEPLILAMEAVDSLGENDILRLVVHREPHMLFAELSEKRVPWKIAERGNPDWVIRIGKGLLLE